MRTVRAVLAAVQCVLVPLHRLELKVYIHNERGNGRKKKKVERTLQPVDWLSPTAGCLVQHINVKSQIFQIIYEMYLLRLN